VNRLHVTTVRLEQEQIKALKSIASRRGMRFSDLIRRMIASAIRRDEQDQARARRL